VPAVDPRLGADAVHLYYVLRHDLEGLRELARLGATCIGALRALQRSGVRLPCEAALARAGAWARVVEQIVACAAVGRGRPVGRAELEAAGLSERYLEGLSEMAREEGGDARALLERLRQKKKDERAKGIHASTLDAVQASLEREGYLDLQERLDAGEAWRRTLAVAGELPEALRPSPEDLRARFEWLWALWTAPRER
jgi:hypothetical protein